MVAKFDDLCFISWFSPTQQNVIIRKFYQKNEKRDHIKIDYLFFPVRKDCDIIDKDVSVKDFLSLQQSENMLSAESFILPKSDCDKYVKDSLHIVSRRLRNKDRVHFEIMAKKLSEESTQLGHKSSFDFPIEITANLTNISKETVYYLSNHCTPNQSQIEYDKGIFEKERIGCASRYWASLFSILPGERVDFTMKFDSKGIQDEIKLGYDLFEVPKDFNLLCIKPLNIEYYERPESHKNILWAETVILNE